MVEEGHGVRESPWGEIFDWRALGEELPQEAVGIFAAAALPRAIRIGKEHGDSGALCEQFMLGEFLATIERGAATLGQRNLIEQLLELAAHAAGPSILRGHRQEIARLAIDQRDYAATVPGSQAQAFGLG